MNKVIIQKVNFPVSALELFSTYMNPKMHAKSIGAPTKVSMRANTDFSTFDGYITGKTLFIEKGKRIVQSWRCSDWKKTDRDSYLVLSFIDIKGGSELHMLHAGVPKDKYASIKMGWNEHYWSKWQQYFKRR